MQAQMIPVSQIRESGSNPRRRRSAEKDAELLESVRALGVLQPVLARPAGEAFELVFGHRRLRAAREAALEEIPGVVREMSDVEVLEAQVAENAQRDDVHPLEEADAYRALHERHGRSVEDIASRVGKSRGYVYARMKLCELGEAGREAFLAGEIEASVALLLARVPAPLQPRAAKRIAVRGFDGERLSYRDAQRIVRYEFMLELSGAPWALDDASLVPSAGACTTCPKRTGSQPELFADVGSADVCADPNCFASKRDAAWQQRRAAARLAGQAVLETKKEVARIFGSSDLNYEGRKQYRDLHEQLGYGKKSRKLRYLLRKPLAANELRITLARDTSGGIHELVDRRAAIKALRAAGYDANGEKLGPRDEAAGRESDRNSDREREKRRRLALAEGEVERRVIAALAQRFAILDAGAHVAILRLLVEDVADSPSIDTFVRALALDAESEGDEKAVLDRWIGRAGLLDLAGLIVAANYVGAYSDGARKIAPHLGIDWDAEVKSTAEGLAQAQPASAQEGRRRRAAVRACRECGCTDEDGCFEGCYWVEAHLCSACASEGETTT